LCLNYEKAALTSEATTPSDKTTIPCDKTTTSSEENAKSKGEIATEEEATEATEAQEQSPPKRFWPSNACDSEETNH
jgi:hypothetical protein